MAVSTIPSGPFSFTGSGHPSSKTWGPPADDQPRAGSPRSGHPAGDRAPDGDRAGTRRATRTRLPIAARVRHHGVVASDQTPVLVLAGGGSRRMGHDKRVALVDGVPMLLRTLERLAPSPMLVIVDPRHPPSIALPAHIRVVPDSRPGEGPLAALEAGLRAVTHDVVLVVGADMPRLEPAVLELLVDRLAQDPPVAVACLAAEARPRPLPLALRRAPVLARLPALLDAGERRLRVLLDGARAVPPSEWLPLDPTRGTLHDVDTPADLAAAP